LEEKSWGCLKQTAIGCGVLMVIAVAIPILLGVVMMGPFKRAVDTRLTIEKEFGPQETYVPPASGAPSADHIEAFLSIRRALAEPCTDLTKAEEHLQKLEAIDEQDDVNRMEVMKDVFSLTKSMMGVGPVLGKLYEIRNQNLLDAGMGLGEFTYIFVLAYRDQILNVPEGDRLFGPSVTNRRVRRALLAMLESQLAALRSAGGEDDEIAGLEAEIAAMQDDYRRIPWQDATPPAIVEAFAPYREELDELFCSAMAPLELMINVRHGPAVESL